MVATVLYRVTRAIPPLLKSNDGKQDGIRPSSIS